MPNTTLSSQTTDKIAEILRKLPDLEIEAGKPVDLRKLADKHGIETSIDNDTAPWGISYDT